MPNPRARSSMKVSLFKSSGQAPRPKSHHQSIRGRISGPIPIANPADDDEFPMRNPGTGIATKTADEEFPIRRRGTGIASPTPIENKETEPGTPPRPAQTQPQQKTETDTGSDGSDEDSDGPRAKAVEVVEESAPPPPAVSGPSPVAAAAATTTPNTTTTTTSTPTAAAGSQSSPVQHRTNPSSTLRYSQISAVSTSNTGQSSGAQPQRKKSTLRGALSKLFGRKKKTNSQASEATGASNPTGPTTQHRSDPLAATPRLHENEPKRSASLPITEYDRALRSHSVGPDDITAIESVRDSLQLDSLNKRRATTISSKLYSRPRRGEPGGEWAGLSPRPASTHGRGSRPLSMGGDNDDPEQIGRAITSDLLGDFALRRRSRSLSGLPEGSDSQQDSRRRSDEIRYWRESYDPGFLSPLSSAHGLDTERGGSGNNDDTGAISLHSLPDSPATDHPPKTPPQPFVFGNIANMNEMAGMKITQAAGMETRIGTLEARMQRLERVVDQLCHSVPGFKTPLAEMLPTTFADQQTPRSVPIVQSQLQQHGVHNFAHTNAAPPMIPAVYQAMSPDVKGGPASSSRYSSSRQLVDTTEGGQSHMSFGDGQITTATQAQSIPAVAVSQANRPTSTSTVRGAASLPHLNAVIRGGNDDNTSPERLAAQLEEERAARHELEVQLKTLKDRVNSLSSTMFAMVRDPQKSRSHERLAPPSPSPSPSILRPTSSGTGGSVATPTKGGAPAVPRVPLSATAPKPRSVFEDDSDFEGPKRSRLRRTDTEDDETASEAFMTPREEQQPPVYGAFGEELDLRDDYVDDEDDEDAERKRKKAARTLSLGQLTLGKGPRAQQ